MNQVKRRMEAFSFYDRTAIQSYLEKMAERGWLVESPGNYLWRYRRIKPQTLHFAVTYFPNASDFDPGPTDGQRQMEEYCARDGWIPAARWGQMQIFYNEGANPTPIETDAPTQVETIRSTMRRTMLPTQLVLLVLSAYQLVLGVGQFFSDPVALLSKPYSLCMLVVWVQLLLSALWELCFYVVWYRRARTAAASGNFPQLKTKRLASVLLLLSSTLTMVLVFAYTPAGRWSLVLCFGMVLLIVFAVSRVKTGMKRRGVSRGTNRAVSVGVSVVLTFAVMAGVAVVCIRYGFMDGRHPVGTYEEYGITRKVYADAIPLRIEGLTEVGAVLWSTEQRAAETFLLANTEYRQWPLSDNPHIPALEYTVIDVKLPLLYTVCKTALTRSEDVVQKGEVVFEDHYDPIDAAPWGAQEAYRLYWSGGYANRYLLCYDSRIVELRFEWTPTSAQMAVVAEKLGGAQNKA